MEIVKPDQAGITQAVKILKTGGVIVYPTDTAYALGGIFDSPKVVKKILAIKRRRDPKFTLIADSLKQVVDFFRLSQPQKKLGKKFWPAPLSIVVSQKYAVRVPNHQLARTLAHLTAKPIIATSANLSGTKTLYDSKQIISEFSDKKSSRSEGERPDLIIDAGKLKKVKTSTIVQITGGNKVEVIRNGSFKLFGAGEIN